MQAAQFRRTLVEICCQHLVQHVRREQAGRIDQGFQGRDIGRHDGPDRSDPTRNAQFRTFAFLRIRGAIVDELRRNSPLPQELLQHVTVVSKAQEKLAPPITIEALVNLTGLSSDEVFVYSALLKGGAVQASALARHLPLSRPLIYKILADLEKKGLVEKIERAGAVARFSPGHPYRLREYIEQRLKDAERAQVLIDGTMAGLVSEYNIATGKPGIRFFEGKAGIKEVLDGLEGDPCHG